MFTEAERETETETKAATTTTQKVDTNIKAELERMKQWEDAIQKASKRFDVPAEEIRAIIGTESAAMPNRRADDGAKKKSSGGARGLMQVVKSTWDQMKSTYTDLAPYDFESNWNKPAINIMFGTATLASKRKALKSFGMKGPNSEKMAVIAYNAGEGVVRDAYNHAKDAGSQRPDVDFMKFEHLAYAIKKNKAYKYWMPGNGGEKSNKSGTVDEAVKLKIEREVMGYAGKVEKRMNAQGKSLDTTSSTTKETQKTETQKTETQKTETQKTETQKTEKTETQKTETDQKTDTDKPSKTEDVTVTVGELVPIKPGHIISDSVGRGGKNRGGDVLTVQQQLARHGISPGTEDAQIGKNTIKAIETFQKRFMKKPDGLVEVGKATEKHLMEGMQQQKEEKEQKKEDKQTEQDKTDTKMSEEKPVEKTQTEKKQTEQKKTTEKPTENKSTEKKPTKKKADTTVEGTTTATPGRGWGGCEGLADLAKSIAASMNMDIKSEKRSKTDFGGGRKSTTTSDHHVSQKNAYAVDFGTGKFGKRGLQVGTDLAHKLAKAYGLKPPYIGTYQRHYIMAGGRKFRVQLLWQVKDHYDHVHIGFRTT